VKIVEKKLGMFWRVGKRLYFCRNENKSIYMQLEIKSTRVLLGETYLDLGKLTFAGSALSGVFERNFDNPLLVLAGFATSMFFMSVGIYLMTKKNKKGGKL
jgi:hypothetical protein